MSEERKKPKDFERSFTREVVCPYCGKEQSDSWELGDDGDMDCGYCEREFSYTRDVEVTYSSYPNCICRHSEGHHFGQNTECHQSHTEYFLKPDKDGNSSGTVTCKCVKFISIDSVKNAV